MSHTPQRPETVGSVEAPGPPADFALDLKTRDFDELTLAFRTWDAGFRQLGRGPFEGWLRVVHAGGVEVLHLTSNRALLARGRQRQPSVIFSLVLPTNEGASWRGQHLRAGQINLLGPWDVMDHRTSASYEALSLNVDLALLQRAAEALHRVDVEGWLRGRIAVTPPPPALAGLEGLLRRLTQPGTRPGLVRLDPARAQVVSQECVRLLLNCLLGAPREGPARDRRTNRREALRRVEEYMEANLKSALTIEALCAEADVSERTLDYAFRERFGLSPMAYFKALRLNAIRQELKRADPCATALHEVACRWGLRHGGAFAADYRRQFAELPSETLRTATRRPTLASAALD